MNRLQVTGSSAFRMDETDQLLTFVPMKFAKRSGRKEVISPDDASEPYASQMARPDTTLLTALAKAFHWQRLIDLGLVSSGTEIAKREGKDLTVVNELLRLIRLDPLIVEEILQGTQPVGFTLNWFARNAMPVEWPAQRAWIEKCDGEGVEIPLSG